MGSSGSSAHAKPLGKSGGSMKKDEDTEDLLPEYDFRQMAGGVRGKYAAAFRQGTNLVRLDPDVAKAFTTDESVNEALRAVLRAAAAIPSTPQPQRRRYSQCGRSARRDRRRAVRHDRLARLCSASSSPP